MARPANTERNRDLVKKRVTNPEKWSYRALSRHFRIDIRSAWEIFQRDLTAYANREEIKRYKAKIQALGLSTG